MAMTSTGQARSAPALCEPGPPRGWPASARLLRRGVRPLLRATQSREPEL